MHSNEDPVIVLKDGEVVIYDDEHPYGYIPVHIERRPVSFLPTAEEILSLDIDAEEPYIPFPDMGGFRKISPRKTLDRLRTSD